jgi:hypothetical protein
MTTVETVSPHAMLGAVRQVVTGADEVLLCVAFANRAGIELLAPSLRGRPGRVRLLATTVFGDTTGAALRRAVELGVDVRVLNLPRGTFHPKLYLSRSADRAAALVGSANLTSGLLRNLEVGVLLRGGVDDVAPRELRSLAEEWWHHDAAVPWMPDATAVSEDAIVPDLWQALEREVPAGTVVRTLRDGRPNRIVERTAEAVWIETERSARLGRGAEKVPAWMLNIAWDHLVAHGRLTNAHLLATDGLNVKRSSAVCAVLAALSLVEVTSRSPIELRLRCPTVDLAAEREEPYRS